MNPPRTVLLDLDGTLADTAPALGLALNMQRVRHGLPELAQDIIRPHASHGSRGLLGIGFGITPEHPDFAARREEYLALYDAVFTRDPVLFCGMSEVLAVLECAGVAWGIVTNKPRRFTVPLVQALGLSARAACVVSGDDAAQSKPAPDTLLLACTLTHCAPSECWYVGDAERDVVAGHAAGITTVVARYGYLEAHERPELWGAEALIDAPGDLLRLPGLASAIS